MKAKHLNPTKDDGVSTIAGRPVADPGFLKALQKIAPRSMNTRSLARY
jgi:hypothetical protein